MFVLLCAVRLNPDHLQRKPTALMVGVLSRPQLCSSSPYHSTPNANRCSRCTRQQRLGLLVVRGVLNPTRCDLLVLTSCAKCYQETGTRHWLCCVGSSLDSSHRTHGGERRRGNHRAVCVLVVLVVFAGVRSPQPVMLGRALETALPAHRCSLQRVTGL